MSNNDEKKKRGRPRKTSRWSPEEKLRIIAESLGLSDEELGAFMRREGLHEVNLREMRAAALAGLQSEKRVQGPTPEQQENTRLKRELRRKEKALAEAAALLVLQKKFNALLEEEGDDTDGNNGDDY